MLDAVALQRLNELFDVHYVESVERVAAQARDIDATHAAKGMYATGARFSAMAQMALRELNAWAMQVWLDIVRVHGANGSQYSEAIRDQARRLLQERLDKRADDLIRMVGVVTKDVPGANAAFLAVMRNGHTQAIRKHLIEVDLYMDGMQKKADGAIAPSVPTYNFYAPVGSVQTGANATANVFQTLGGDERGRLQDALAQVRDLLERDTSLSPDKRRELSEIVSECVAGIQQDNPNSSKLMAMLNLIGTTIQSIAGAGPAYEAMRAALIPIGVMLP